MYMLYKGEGMKEEQQRIKHFIRSSSNLPNLFGLKNWKSKSNQAEEFGFPNKPTLQ